MASGYAHLVDIAPEWYPEYFHPVLHLAHFGILNFQIIYHYQNPELSPLTWQKRVSIAMDVCEGLKYLHERPKQIVHRDIKPSNILLDENDDAKVTHYLQSII